jgi:uncharacterized delta-60 repeat protein
MQQNNQHWLRHRGARVFTRLPIALFCALSLLTVLSRQAAADLLDATFNVGTGAEGGFIESMLVEPDGKILVCGNFTSFNGYPRSYIARLNPDGSVDPAFTADVGYWVRSMARQSDGKIIVGGFFGNVGWFPRNCVARLNSDGSLDETFDPGTGCEGRVVEADPTDSFVFSVAAQMDGKVVIGGNFATFNGVASKGIARLNSDGSLDSTFQVGSGVNSWVRSLQVEANDRILASGWFTSYNGQSADRMVLINTNGTRDSLFNPYFGESCAVYTAARQMDQKIVVVGHTISSDFEKKIARLNTDGSYDGTFDVGTGANEKVEGVAIQSDGKIVIAGYFTDYNNYSVNNIARLEPNGALDASFNVATDNWIWTVLLQADGRILICGAFTTVNGHSRSGIARLLPADRPMPFQPRYTGAAFTVAVPTQAGKNYSLQYKNEFSATTWDSLPAIAGDGTIKILSDLNPSSNARFYRVLME